MRGGVLKKEEYGACRVKYLQLSEKAREKEQLGLGEGGVTQTMSARGVEGELLDSERWQRPL